MNSCNEYIEKIRSYSDILKKDFGEGNNNCCRLKECLMTFFIYFVI